MTTPDSLPWFRAIAIARARRLPVRVKTFGFDGIIAHLRRWQDRYKGRRTIRSMTSEQIAELDLDPVTLREEGEKPFWRA